MKRIINWAVLIFLVYLIWSVITRINQGIDSEGNENARSHEVCDEFSWADSIQSTDVRMMHIRSWNKYTYDSLYCLAYSVRSSEIESASFFRNQLSSRERIYENYWRAIYYELYEHDKDLISFLQDSLQQLAAKDHLSKFQFANLIVSFVQDIPYNYVVPGPCDRSDHPCRGNEKFGILSPVEFLFSLSGDCDTRSVLLYSMLRHFGFSPLIMISNEYRHAMIAIDLPASGDYIVHKGRKFYFWETTNTGWLPGMLPPDVNNIAYWKITLDHEYQALSSGTR